MFDYFGSHDRCHCDGGLVEAIFGFRAAQEQEQVRAFYGDFAYEAIRKWEAQQRADHERRMHLLYFGELIDDVFHAQVA